MYDSSCHEKRYACALGGVRLRLAARKIMTSIPVTHTDDSVSVKGLGEESSAVMLNKTADSGVLVTSNRIDIFQEM